MQMTAIQISILTAPFTSGMLSSGMKEPISPPLPPVMKLRSEGRIGSLRSSILIWFATENTTTIAENSAVAVQKRLSRNTNTRYSRPMTRKFSSQLNLSVSHIWLTKFVTCPRMLFAAFVA